MSSISLHYTTLNKKLGENFCPLCETISNCFLFVANTNKLTSINDRTRLEFNSWFLAVHERFLAGLDTDLIEDGKNYFVCRDQNNNEGLLSENSIKMTEDFAMTTAKLTSHETGNRLNFYACVWSNCSYTIQTTGKIELWLG